MNLKKVLPYIAGAAPGVALGTMGFMQVHSSAKKSFDTFQKDLVDTKKTVKKYAPGVRVATNINEIEGLNIPPFKNITPAQKDVLYAKFNRILSSGNAANLKNYNAIVARPMINRSLIGHEIGHRIDNDGKESILDKIFISRDEQRAWNKSPFQDEASRKASQIALGTYRGAEKVMGAAALTPIGLLLAHKLMKK
jgi:hypothetical protein